MSPKPPLYMGIVFDTYDDVWPLLICRVLFSIPVRGVWPLLICRVLFSIPVRGVCVTQVSPPPYTWVSFSIPVIVQEC